MAIWMLQNLKNHNFPYPSLEDSLCVGYISGIYPSEYVQKTDPLTFPPK